MKWLFGMCQINYNSNGADSGLDGIDCDYLITAKFDRRSNFAVAVAIYCATAAPYIVLHQDGSTIACAC